MIRIDKRAALQQLAINRQQARWPGYTNIGDFHGGAYECLHVCPYTKSAGNVDAAIMVMLQDWASEDWLNGELDEHARQHGYSDRLPTNRNLIRLLQANFRMPLWRTYATDLFPFIKPGHMGRKIPRRDLVRAAMEFALPQVRIVNPKLVICLGLQTYNALRKACGLTHLRRLAEAIDAPYTFQTARIWCQAHTGGRGQAMRGRLKVLEDWARMKEDAGMAAAAVSGVDLLSRAA